MMNSSDGFTAHDWQQIRTIFEQNFADQLEMGASLCIYHREECVVDLWGGWKDPDTKQEPYISDTLQLVFSTSKGVMDAAVAVCVDRGWLDYETPIAQYWPEFGVHGKQNITLGCLLAHRAGLSYIDEELNFEDVIHWSRMTSLIAVQKPQWEPGKAHGYHAHTIGYVVGELIQRVDPFQRSYGTFIRDEIDRDFYVGISDDQVQARVAPLISRTIDTPQPHQADSSTNKSLTCNGALPLGDSTLIYNDIRLHRAQLPAVNGITHARSLARIYARLIGHIDEHGQKQKRLIGKDTLQEATKDLTPVGEPDRNWHDLFTTFSKGAFQTYGPCFNILDDRVFGHSGYGGSCAFAHPDHQLAYAYVCNYLDPSALTVDRRSTRLIEAVQMILAKQNSEKRVHTL